MKVGNEVIGAVGVGGAPGGHLDEQCAVAGIATSFCVLTTAMDSLCHDFKTVILEDCATAFSEQAHTQCLDLYRKNPLYPLFRIMTSTDLILEL